LAENLVFSKNKTINNLKVIIHPLLIETSGIIQGRSPVILVVD